MRDFLHNRKTLPKDWLFSREYYLTMIWSIYEKIFTQSIKVERKSSLGAFLTPGRAYLLNNYSDEFKLHPVFLYCATVFSWNKCCGLVLKLPNFLAVTAKYWKHPVKKYSDIVGMNDSHVIAATFRIKHSTGTVDTVQAKRRVAHNFGGEKERHFVGMITPSFNIAWPFFWPFRNLTISFLGLIYQFRKFLLLMKFLLSLYYVILFLKLNKHFFNRNCNCIVLNNTICFHRKQHASYSLYAIRQDIELQTPEWKWTR